MLIDKYIKQVETCFRLEKEIQEAILEERERRLNKRSRNPTEDMVVNKIMPVRKVRVSYKQRTLVVEQPEKWLAIIKVIYAAYSNHPICSMVRMRLEDNKSPEVISGVMGISRETYYGWYREFFRDAVFVACSRGLLNFKM